MSELSRTFGLTGGIASGKTTVARMFEELGAKVIDADRLGHELIRKSLPAYHDIVSRFGEQVLDSSGEIDRQRLGTIVFADPEKLRELNSILHPRILARAEELARQYHAENLQAVVLVDAALVYEAGLAEGFRKVIVTWCRPEQQLERLVGKTGSSRQEAEQRLAAQMPTEEKRRRADYVIDCSGDTEMTRQQVVELYPQLKQLA